MSPNNPASDAGDFPNGQTWQPGLRTCRSCDKLTLTDPCNWCGKASNQPSDESCATPECGHIERWHKHGRCAGDMLSCSCRSFVAPSSPVVVPPAGPPDDADDPWWVARGEYQKAMDEADRLTSEAAGITAAAEAAWLAFARGYLKERKVDHV